MTTQKVFKQRVRTRMTKTGESYTAARMQLLRKAPVEPATPAAEAPPPVQVAAGPPTSDDAARRATGRSYEDWFGVLDEWGARNQTHTQIARWLVGEHGVDGWWSQSITVGYERARGLRALHQMANGFSVGATRTVGSEPAAILAAFTEASIRRQWLPGVELRRRPTTARNVARFDWQDPPSRLLVALDPKGPNKTAVAIAHEKLPDGSSAVGQKAAWRERLSALKAFLESGGSGPA